MRKRTILFSVYIIAVAMILLVAIRCNSVKPVQATESNPHTWLNNSDTVKYVGINTCKKCHYDVYQSFIQTGMGQSFAHASKQKSKGHFEKIAPLYDKYSDLYYQPYWEDTILKLKEYRLAGKDTVHKRIEAVSYIVGSGHHTNSHIMDVNGYLYQMPFTFYVQKQELDLPPGFEHGYNSRFNRQLGLECLSCHNAYPGFVQGSVNKYDKIPEGIDCERCHGPGSLHVAQKMLGKTVDIKQDTDFTIVNPRKLPFDLQIDVCQRCHLQGDAVLKTGKSFFDFRPGMKLSDVMDVFLPTYEDDEKGFLMAAHAQRLKKSQCFLQSNKPGARTQPMNCITCHNPHVSVRVTQIQFFNDKCQGCHKDAHGCKLPEEKRKLKDNNCVSCHMPRSGSVDIPHVSITDHYIRRYEHYNKETASGKVGKFKGLECLDNKHPDKITVAKAYMYFYEKFEHKSYNLDSASKYLNYYTPNFEPEAFIYYYYLREDFESILKIASGISIPYKEAVTNYQVAKSALNLGQFQMAVNYFQKAISLEQFNLDYHNQYAIALLRLNNSVGAEKEYQFITKENPRSAMGWNGLAFLDLFKNNISSAKENIKKALALDPDYEPALINNVKISEAIGDKKEALRQVNLILKKNPNSKDAKEYLNYLKAH